MSSEGKNKFMKVNLACDQHSLVIMHCLCLSDVIDFAMVPAQRFWRETVSLLDVT